MSPEPRATYRLQLAADFGFAAAERLVPYLADLKVSHLYLSPVLEAARGSPHGYDVVDPTRVSRERGGAAAFESLAAAAGRAGLGILLDLVPNHMAIEGARNPWWWDVLKRGPDSRYAAYFDVDWERTPDRYANRILLPVLGDHYGRVLDAGEICIARAGAELVVRYHEHEYPLDPATVAELTDREIERLNADPDARHELLEAQHYRLAFWRAADRDLGYRRFFDVQSLAGLRMEDEEVFRATHALPIRWYADGLVQGFRIDHPDGLRDPRGYLDRLAAACPGAWIVVEKILEPGESLPPDWPVSGTTGYDFLNLVGGLFVDPRGEAAFDRLYAEFTGEVTDYRAVLRRAKREVLTDLFGSELNRLAARFVAVCENHRRHRDYTRHELREALLEVAAAFPVYRTYVRAVEGEVSPTDVRHVETAVAAAKEARSDLSPELFDLLADLLLLRVRGENADALAMRFQQITGPAMAKGAEDTAFYRFVRFAALAEVGGDPGRFGVAPETFHRAMVDAAERRPHSLLATSTHDTKWSGDVRARLAALSEGPESWGAFVRTVSARAAPYRTGDRPDRRTEYLLWQTIVGAWPLETDRAIAFLLKAAREAKDHTAWTRIDADYEEALRTFVEGVLADEGIREEIQRFLPEIDGAGRLNSLAMTLLLLTAPGVPDLYRGTELFERSLVDPDNRRPVDFDARVRALARLRTATPEEAMARPEAGDPKLFLIHRALRLRREIPAAFGPGAAYRPLAVTGAGAGHAIAFLRGGRVAVVAPCRPRGVAGGWGDTAVELPGGRFWNALTGEETTGGRIRIGGLLRRFPVGLLSRGEER